MKIIDLFCGIGGLSLGFEQAGFEVVTAIDMWADAVKTFNHHREDKVAEVEEAASSCPVQAIEIE